MPEYRVSVRELAEFCHRRGDIDYRFSPSPSAEEGIAGHQRLQSRRGYTAEYALDAVFDAGEFTVRVAGRADGYSEQGPLLEEIKTCRVRRESIPEPVEAVHMAQLMLYGGLLCHGQPELGEVELQLTYLNIDTEEEWMRRERQSASTLRQFLDDSVAEMQRWLRLQHQWRQRRDESLEALAFPFPAYRPGQREMAETVYKCIASKGQLLIEAPTGTGKTAAVLYPALKALAVGKHERICYVTARTVGRFAAEDTLRNFEAQGMALRRLSVSAKETICFSPGRACHGDDCPYARGYYDRLPAALQDAMREEALDRAGIEHIARVHSVCPYQLGMDLLPWVDLCIGDIHYVYSFNASISGHYSERRLHWTVLLDEAHNLPARAREMYSAELEKQRLMEARRESSGAVRRALDRCNRVLLELNREPWQVSDFHSREQPSEALLTALQRFVGAVGEQQVSAPLYLQQRPALLDFYFAALQFHRVLEVYADDYRFELRRSESRQSLVVKLRCLDASRLLSENQRRPTAVTAFSATVSPADWVLRELGFGDAAVFSSLASPFDPGQFDVVLDTTLDIRYRAREASLPALAATLVRWLEEHPGNCIVYFSAYSYMADAVQLLRDRTPRRHICVQERNWREAERAGLLATLREREDVVAFCILGGVFGEGIDLPGAALKSVVVVGVGLPQFNREREVLNRYYRQKLGRGFEYAYQYPGMQRVCQALGRVVRCESDTGSALLIDSRYQEAGYRGLLPPWWHYRSGSEATPSVATPSVATPSTSASSE
jgi:DNA excision repair protein ERCC-2